MTETEDRHASWLELFFDLVVVAAVAQLAHRVHEDPSAWGIAAFALLYYAIWSVWTSFTLYVNVAGDRARSRAMLIAMFGIAVMAAAVPATIPGVLHEDPGVDRSTVFAIAYVVCRLIASGTWNGTGQILTAWPAAQVGAVHFLATGLLALSAKAPWHWLLGWALPCVALPVLLGVFGTDLHASLIAMLLAAVVLWQVAYRPLSRRIAATR